MSLRWVHTKGMRRLSPYKCIINFLWNMLTLESQFLHFPRSNIRANAIDLRNLFLLSQLSWNHLYHLIYFRDMRHCVKWRDGDLCSALYYVHYFRCAPWHAPSSSSQFSPCQFWHRKMDTRNTPILPTKMSILINTMDISNFSDSSFARYILCNW